jgi:hypothetical protein
MSDQIRERHARQSLQAHSCHGREPRQRRRIAAIESCDWSAKVPLQLGDGNEVGVGDANKP